MLDLQRYAEKKKEIDRIHYVLKIKKKNNDILQMDAQKHVCIFYLCCEVYSVRTLYVHCTVHIQTMKHKTRQYVYQMNNQGCNVRKVNCGCVYSSYILNL